ncbi:MAG: T9SS type A sorting domain-containing protein [Ignavibacteriae bacterium]|nr:T9SS C-terminal target domain-containing protein [Ignavibacteriota bacterium]NOH00184.1 T9SS type A sorting domain-containing protein [Ignavibacteriota bacterium]
MCKTNFSTIIVLILSLLICNKSKAQWSQVTDMPTARNAHAVGMVNGKIYAVGGEQANSRTLEDYDPITDTWTAREDMLTARSFLTCNVVNQKIYAIGGYNTSQSQSTVPAVEEYNPATDTWETKSPMPEARWGHGTAVIDEKIYVIAGARNWPINRLYNDVKVYDPVLNTWTTKSSVSIKRWGVSCCVVDGKIYVIGGYNGTGISTVEVYDPESDSWTTKSPLPTPRWGHTTSVVNGKIYVIGGAEVYPPTEALSLVEEYDPVTDSWTPKAPMPVGRIAHAPSSVSIDGKIYLVGGGGLESTDVYSEVFVFKPCDFWIVSAGISSKNILPNGDSLKIAAQIENPENHQLNVFAVVNGEENVNQDSIQLFENGLDDVGTVSSSLWSGEKWFSSLPEDVYSIEFSLNASRHLLPFNIHCTSAGPIIIESYSVVNINNTTVGLGDFTLRNNGSVKTIRNVKAKLKTENSCVTEIYLNNTSFGDIGPGESKTEQFGFAFYHSCSGLVEFELEISSNGIVYWRDSLTIDLSPTDVENEISNQPKDYVLEQNFPNPFNPTTSISYSIPKQSHVNLKVFDVLGNEIAEIVNEEKPIGTFEIEFDASNLVSGIYFYKLRAGGFVETKKMIFLK